jgi:small subunit ribosomal protein S5
MDKKEEKTNQDEVKKDEPKKTDEAVVEDTARRDDGGKKPVGKKTAEERPVKRGGRPGGRGGRGKKFGGRGRGEDREFDQRTVDIARVTRVTRGGKRMRFRSLVVVGNRKGRVGYGIAKGADVAISVNKSVAQAKKRMINVPIVDETIPHEVRSKFAAAEVLLKPATRGSGIKAGGAVRIVLELAGIPNITGKILGGKNKINNVKATFKALSSLIEPDGNKQVKAGNKKSEKNEGTKAKDEKGGAR